jgi:hypothetical protein
MPLGDGSDWTDTRCGHGCGGLLYPPPLRSNAEMLPVAEGGKEASNSPHHLPLHPPHTTPHYPFFSPLPFPPSPLSPPPSHPLSPPRLPLPNARPLPLAPNLPRHMPPHDALLPERRLLPQLAHVHLARLGLVHEAGAVREGVALGRGGA